MKNISLIPSIKKVSLFIIVLITYSLIFSSCKKNENIIGYNTSTSYVYFGLRDSSTLPTVINYLDSTKYSFALDSLNLQYKIIKIPINISGLASPQSRNYSFKIIKDSSYYDSTLVQIGQPIIGASRYTDTLEIKVFNNTKLDDTIMKIYLQLQDNDNFKVGYVKENHFKVYFTNILLEPEWWERWEDYMGPYIKEVYQQWIVLYAKGIDPTPDVYTDEPYVYYWNNMPKYPLRNSYPVTMQYVDVLRQYFVDHVVYPNNDKTLPRILLP